MTPSEPCPLEPRPLSVFRRSPGINAVCSSKCPAVMMSFHWSPKVPPTAPPIACRMPMSYAFRLLARLFQRLCGVAVAALDRHARTPGDRRPTSDAFDRDLFFCVFLRIHRLSGKRFGENIKGPLDGPRQHLHTGYGLAQFRSLAGRKSCGDLADGIQPLGYQLPTGVLVTGLKHE